MDDFRVSSTSPYAQGTDRRQPDRGKRHKHDRSADATADDEIVLSSGEPELADEELLDTYSPSRHTED